MFKHAPNSIKCSSSTAIAGVVKASVIAVGCLLASTVLAANQTATPKSTTQPTIKNLILMIGDGMGPQQIGLLQEYAKRAPNSIYLGKDSHLVTLANQGVLGMSLHGPADKLVVDSACSATQLASGVAAGNEMIGLDRQGQPVATILERAKQQGKATGLVSDTRLTHATPAAFAAHQIHRSKENDIAIDMLQNAKVDVMLSGGLRHFLPSDIHTNPHRDYVPAILKAGLRLTSKRSDNRDLLNEAKAKGYTLAFNRTQLNAINSNKILGLFAESGMADGIESRLAQKPDEPTLAAMTQTALTALAKNPDGFFLMVEGGQIDWAAHNNDAGTLLNELVKFDHAVKTVMDFAKSRDDTLVIVTADHETGGFGYSYNGADLPQPEKLANAQHDTYQPNFNFGALSTLDKLYAQRMSYQNIWLNYNKVHSEQANPNPEHLMSLFNRYSEFKLDAIAAKQIVTTSLNPYYHQGHSTLGEANAHTINDFSSFYVYLSERPLNLMGRALAEQQNIVWSTGTHTHTPVNVIAYGPNEAAAQFAGFMTHVELGKKMQTILLGQ
jgi:alkaline phosphatase